MEEKNVEEIVKELKVMLFDIIAQNEAQISVLEQAIVQEQDAVKEEALRVLWAKYNNNIKTAINTTDILSESLRGLEKCEQEYINFFQENNKQEVEAKDPITKIETVMEEKQEVTTPVEEPAKEEPASEVVETPETPTVEPPVAEAPAEETVVEQEVTTPVEEPVKEEPASEVVETPAVPAVETPVAEAPAEEVVAEQEVTTPVEEPVKEEPVSEVVETPTVEAPVAEAPVETAAPEVVEQPAAPEVVEAPIPEVAQEEVQEEKKETPIVDIPKEEPKPLEPLTPTNEKQEVVAAVQLPTIEEENESPQKLDEEVVDDSNKTVIQKNYDKDDRAILINQSQATKLRSSKETQKALYETKNNTSVTEQQLEEMLGQVTALYEEGKTKEAEELSNQINELSKVLKKAA